CSPDGLNGIGASVLSTCSSISSWAALTSSCRRPIAVCNNRLLRAANSLISWRLHAYALSRPSTLHQARSSSDNDSEGGLVAVVEPRRLDRYLCRASMNAGRWYFHCG